MTAQFELINVQVLYCTSCSIFFNLIFFYSQYSLMKTADVDEALVLKIGFARDLYPSFIGLRNRIM